MSVDATTAIDLGQTNSIDIISERVTLDGMALLDVGCGDMGFSRLLAEHGARVLAIDPDPDQAERNRAADSVENLRFEQAGAEMLPVADASIDGICFVFSLHHVPASVYPTAIAEIVRALRPGGFLCVVEPVNGPLDDVIRFFHDEDQEKADAQAALRQLAVPAFESHAVFDYHGYIEFESFDAFARRYGGKTFNDDYTEADIRTPQVEAAFHQIGQPDFRFRTPKQMMLLERLKPNAVIRGI